MQINVAEWFTFEPLSLWKKPNLKKKFPTKNFPTICKQSAISKIIKSLKYLMKTRRGSVAGLNMSTGYCNYWFDCLVWVSSCHSGRTWDSSIDLQVFGENSWNLNWCMMNVCVPDNCSQLTCCCCLWWCGHCRHRQRLRWLHHNHHHRCCCWRCFWRCCWRCRWCFRKRWLRVWHPCTCTRNTHKASKVQSVKEYVGRLGTRLNCVFWT